MRMTAAISLASTYIFPGAVRTLSQQWAILGLVCGVVLLAVGFLLVRADRGMSRPCRWRIWGGIMLVAGLGMLAVALRNGLAYTDVIAHPERYAEGSSLIPSALYWSETVGPFLLSLTLLVAALGLVALYNRYTAKR